MKPLPTVLLVLVAALGIWWLASSDPSPEARPVPVPSADSGAAPEPASAFPSEIPSPHAGGAEVSEPDAVRTPPAGEAPKAVPQLPLADKFIERATWSDESAVVVLEHLSQAAGMGLELSPAMRRRLAAIRVTLGRGRTAVPKVLDLVLQPHSLGWYPRGGAIVVFDDDD